MNIDSRERFAKYSAFIWPFFLIAAGCSVVLISKEKAPVTTKLNANIYYGYPGRNQFSSAENFYKKETKSGHFAQTKIELDYNQKLQIMGLANSLNFFQMTDSFYHYQEARGSKFQWLRLTLDSLDKTVNWRGSLDSLQPKNFQIKQLVLFIDSIVKSTDAYKALPKSEITDD